MARCPNCEFEVELKAKVCGVCNADFGPGSAWKPLPVAGNPLRIKIEPASSPSMLGRLAARAMEIQAVAIVVWILRRLLGLVLLFFAIVALAAAFGFPPLVLLSAGLVWLVLLLFEYRPASKDPAVQARYDEEERRLQSMPGYWIRDALGGLFCLALGGAIVYLTLVDPRPPEKNVNVGKAFAGGIMFLMFGIVTVIAMGAAFYAWVRRRSRLRRRAPERIEPGDERRGGKHQQAAGQHARRHRLTKK